MNKFKVNISGMTCTGCEKHVESALEKIGAKNIESSYRRGEAVFELPDDIEVESAIKAIDEANYQAGEIEEVSSLENVALINEDNYDLLIIGSGAAAFSSAIKAIEYGAKVGMIERGTVGGTCVNIGCVPSKTLLRAGEINHLSKDNPFIGLQTSAGEVDLASLITQKDKLVSELRNQKYMDLIDEYNFDLNERESFLLDTWLGNLPALKEAYELKEEFYWIWDTPDPDEGHLRYSQWRHRCMSSNSKDAYKDLVRAVDNWHVEIFNYFDKRLTNAYTESINSIIRQVERMGRGYSFDALRAKILFNEKLHKKRKPRFNSSAFNKAMLYDTFNWYEVNDHDITDNLGVDFSTLIKNLEKGDL
ncbi:TPA: transposase [Streptococcus agalactiae]